MSRLAAVPTLFALSALVTVSACSSSEPSRSADTTVPAAAPAVSTTPAASSTDATAAAIVPININTATDAEILLIPGVGPRMLREFKEYRPYASIEQFRREIGKYVDKAEVARLEKYIVIR